MESEVLLLKKVGRTATIVLNRPKALNALNLAAVRQLSAHLDHVSAADASCLLMKGAGGKAFCAGGDIKGIYEQGKAGRRAEQLAFFREEYVLDNRIARLNTTLPQVALWDGVVMGGGVGISVHAQYRIATEKSLWAMPETAIGFIPDVGGSWFLPRLAPALGGHALGLYLGLTGARVTGGGLVHTGVATHFVPSAELPALEARLAEAGSAADVRAAVEGAAKDPGPAPFSPADVEDIKALFSGGDALSILHACRAAEARGSRIASTACSSLPKMSPTSLALTVEQLRRGKEAGSLADCFRMEFRLASRVLSVGTDFYEGVRALLVDKDGKPGWAPRSLEEVDVQGVVGQYFAPLPAEEELQLMA